MNRVTGVLLPSVGTSPGGGIAMQFASVLLEFMSTTEPAALVPDDLSNRLREAGAV